MSIDFRLANLLGTVYTKGSLLFSPDGKSVYAPVGNRVSVYNLVDNISRTFSFEHRKPIQTLCLNSQGSLLLSIDENGRGILTNLRTNTVIHHMNFKEPVRAAAFSFDNKFIAIGAGRRLQFWRTPLEQDERQFAPFVRHRVLTGHYSPITHIEFSKDSRFVLTSADDMTANIFSVHSEDAEARCALTGHGDAVIGAFFSDDQENIYTVSRDGSVYTWVWEDKWMISEKKFVSANGRIVCGTFHAKSNLLVLGFSSGSFSLYDMPQCNEIQKLSISQSSIDTVQINSTGEWLLFGSAEHGQLLVWEWQSESYILKQQSHYDSLTSMVYSPDGTKLVTGSQDGKIKVWDVQSGFSMVTFNQHIGPVTDLKFARGNVVYSCSLDGSVRAWDLTRFRNFRTFVAPHRVQFTTLAVDPSGELVCAGSLDDFDIRVWNVQSSQLVDTLSGHEGPVSSLQFAPDGGVLASGSWDHTARIWSFFGRNNDAESAVLQSEVLQVTFKPDGKELAFSTMDGLISFYDPMTMQQKNEIDGKADIGRSGRYQNDAFTAKNNSRSNHFTNICYNVDGSMLLAGGNSRYVCLYDVQNGVLLKKFEISKNMALDGTLDKLNSKNIVDGQALNLIDHDELDDQVAENNIDDKVRRKWAKEKNLMPGANRRAAIKTSGVQFAPSSPSFAIASTEGLLIYSTELGVEFDPIDLDVDVTSENCLQAISKNEYQTALIMAFRLGDSNLLARALSAVPYTSIPVLTQTIPAVYVSRLLKLLGSRDTPHLEFRLTWILNVLETHGRYISLKKQALDRDLRAVQRFLIDARNIMNVSQTNVFKTRVALNS